MVHSGIMRLWLLVTCCLLSGCIFTLDGDRLRPAGDGGPDLVRDSARVDARGEAIPGDLSTARPCDIGPVTGGCPAGTYPRGEIAHLGPSQTVRERCDRWAGASCPVPTDTPKLAECMGFWPDTVSMAPIAVDNVNKPFFADCQMFFTVPGDEQFLCCANGNPTTCQNQQLDTGESDVDCGGPCTPCPIGKMCIVNADCATLACSGSFCGSNE